MNKRLAALICVLMLISVSFSACGRNDDSYVPKKKYKKASLTVIVDRYDNKGRLKYLRLKSNSEGIITAASFSMVDRKGNRLVKKNSSTDFYIRMLNTALLQNQSAKFRNPDEDRKELFTAYQTLASEGLKSMEKSGAKFISVSLEESYTAKTGDYAKDGYRGYISVLLKDGTVRDVSFSRRNRKGQDAASDSAFTERFRKNTSRPYAKYTSSLSSLSKGRSEMVLSEGNTLTDRDYNYLARAVNRKIAKINLKKVKKQLER